MTCYSIDDVRDFATWRRRALQAIQAGLAPDDVCWQPPSSVMSAALQSYTQELSLIPAVHTMPAVSEGPHPAVAGLRHVPPTLLPMMLPADLPEAQLTMSAAFRDLLREAACCRTADRWTVLYLALWQWARGRREVASPADETGARLHRMGKAVRRDRHDFIAYLRFREQDVTPPEPRFVAWYEPDHDTLDWSAEHFADRMGNTPFLIATPNRAASWDGRTLTFRDVPEGHTAGPPAIETRDDGKQDAASTALWLTYYRSIFNPARLNERALVQHLPVRRWRGLPEAALITELIGAARTGEQRVGQVAAVRMLQGHVIQGHVIREQAIPGHATQRHAAVANRGDHAADEACADRSMTDSAQHHAATLETCRRCPLWQHATAALPGEGPRGARLMIVGEQPGDQEDLVGRVFVGPAGQLLNQALERAGIARADVYLTNAVKHFKWTPRGKRRIHKTPQQQEILACRHWLDEEIERVDPQVIVTLGNSALSSVMSQRLALGEHLNRPVLHEGRWIVPTYHPAFALRQEDTAGRERAVATIVKGLTQAYERLS